MAGRELATSKVPDDLANRTLDLFKAFLRDYSPPEDNDDSTTSAAGRQKYYVEAITELKENDRTTLNVDWRHVISFGGGLSDVIAFNYYRLKETLEEGVKLFILDHMSLLRQVGRQHRERQQVTTPGGSDSEGIGAGGGLPDGDGGGGGGGGDDPDADRIRNTNYHVAFEHFVQESGIRDLKTAKIGQLCAINGTVTRTTQVRPELLRGTFRCNDCAQLIENVKQQFNYTEPQMCVNPHCENKTRWELVPEQSRFTDWQMVRIQEDSSSIPPGSMPRSMKVILRGEMVERAKPGDKCIFTGTLIVVPDVTSLSRAGGTRYMRARIGRQNSDAQGVTGLRSLGVRDLSYKMCFLASTVTQAEGGIQEGELNIESFTTQQRQRIVEMNKTPHLYRKMYKSIAPNIFEHHQIKQGILLMLLGGVHKVTQDKSNLRGDINVCVVGDPSTAKSQFLKYVCSFMPRAVYTSGKASSAAGLTAAVTPDPETGEFTIEAGALMLADHGICCIDEFDKMDPKDQVAIHEAMEQQTISIAKAGIQATLNARTSVLAAANPVGGRYDKTKTLRQNVDISAPIMSRFDLFFVVLDDCNEVTDQEIAQHIVNVHLHKEAAVETEFKMEDLQTYIKFAKTLKPQMSPEAKKLFVEYYVNLRQNDITGASKTSYRITVRQLESMIRLAEARCRLDLATTITPKHVKEAARLLETSIVHVEDRDLNLRDKDSDDEDDRKGGGGGEDGGEDGGGGGGGGTGNGMPEEKYDPDTGERSEPKDIKETKIASPVKKPTSGGESIKLSYREYQRLGGLIVSYIKQVETEENEGIKEGEIVAWYTKELEKEGNISGQEDALRAVRILRLVIKSMIKKDHILRIASDETGDSDNRVIAVHPNYDPESGTNVGLDLAPHEQEEEARKKERRKVKVKKERALKLKQRREGKKLLQQKRKLAEDPEEATEPSTEPTPSTASQSEEGTLSPTKSKRQKTTQISSPRKRKDQQQ